MYTPYNEKRHQKHPFYDKAKVQLFFRPQFCQSVFRQKKLRAFARPSQQPSIVDRY